MAKTDETSGDTNGAACLQHIDSAILVNILDYLTFWDGRRLLISSPSLWTLAPDVESKRFSKVVVENYLQTKRIETGTTCISAFHHLQRLQELDLGIFATNSFLELLNAQSLMPNISVLSMIASTNIDDYGFMTLRNCVCRQRNLRYIDITFCHKISYEATLELRTRLPEGAVIRRQPEWMDGRFETNFDNDGIHTYWADGSFSYERAEQSLGFVKEVFLWNPSNPDHVGDKLQYSNFVPPQGWPEWSRYFYRPGVSLLRIPERDDVHVLGNDDIENSSTATRGKERTVLVAQLMRGMRPPSNFPQSQHVSCCHVGLTSYFDRDGCLLSNDDSHFKRHIMITRMKVLPLESLMPPQDLVNRNLTFLKRSKDFLQEGWLTGHSEERIEEFIHRMIHGE